MKPYSMRSFDIPSQDATALGDWARRRSVWLIGIGVLMCVIGVVALGNVIASTFATVFALGWLLIVGGVMHGFAVFTAHRWNMALLDALAAVLYLVVGVFALRQPAYAALMLTAVVATIFMISGIMRVIAALAIAPPHWGWVAVHGIVSFALGSVLYYSLPNSALYFPGLVIAMDLTLSGASLAALGFSLRRLTRAPEAEVKEPIGEKRPAA